MRKNIRQRDRYSGFEKGPHVPVSEEKSLCLRLTRGCPWNRCSFCKTYDGVEFSIRSLDHILRDVDLIRSYLDRIRMIIKPGAAPDPEMIQTLYSSFQVKDRVAFNAAMDWHGNGADAIVLQEADPLVMDTLDMVRVLTHLRAAFPRVKRITAPARTRTLSRLGFHELASLASAGLNRILMGMDSGSNRILTRVRKGATRETLIRTGSMVKEAGIELAAYVIPGLGGVDLSVEHALETASALNAINPDIIYLRSLAVPDGSNLAGDEERNRFERPSDPMMAREIRLMLESLMGITSKVRSRSALNLFENICGTLPQDREAMIAVVDSFFQLSPQDQVHYLVGRRMGYFSSPGDMAESHRMDEVRESCLAFGITPENVDIVIDEMKKRLV